MFGFSLQEGFNECAAEACHFLEKSTDFDPALSERLVEHLETCTGPLSIEVPNYKLTFSPPISPVSIGASPIQSLRETSLAEFTSSGLLMPAAGRKCLSENRNSSDPMWRPWWLIFIAVCDFCLRLPLLNKLFIVNILNFVVVVISGRVASNYSVDRGSLTWGRFGLGSVRAKVTPVTSLRGTRQREFSGSW